MANGQARARGVGSMKGLLSMSSPLLFVQHLYVRVHVPLRTTEAVVVGKHTTSWSTKQASHVQTEFVCQLYQMLLNQ